MICHETFSDLGIALRGLVRVNPDRTIAVTDANRFRDEVIDELVATSVFAKDTAVRDAARWLIWECAHALGAHSASIQGLYEARGRGRVRGGFTVPAVNIRGFTYESARTLFRAGQRVNAGPFVFEIARSEMGYTEQRPAEYATCVMAAAVKERHHGPVFIQGDHFQFNAKKHAADPETEAKGIRDLVVEAIDAGFYNIDIDSSTLVDLAHETLEEQQRLNYERAAEMTAWVRRHEPQGMTISVGGEIGEVGLKNSTVEELRAYMNGYVDRLRALGEDLMPISKVSVQTGTSHGGVPTAGGKVAEVKLDFQVLKDLSRVAREEFGMAGAVQHGASTLPDELFHHFSSVDTAEIHLATGFQNLLFEGDFLPEDLKQEITAWCHANCADEKKPGLTDEQFVYKTRKKSYGPFKRRMWELPEANRTRYATAMEEKLVFLYEQLGLRDSRPLVEQHVRPVLVHRAMPESVAGLLGAQAATAR
jgi:fructose/tagatose bisphosphate aldolase